MLSGPREQFDHHRELSKILGSRKSRSGFIGVDNLRMFHHHQIVKFESHVGRNEFRRINGAHFDWWAFPINIDSSKGDIFKINKKVVKELKEKTDKMFKVPFIEEYKRGHEILALSWGWDLDQMKVIDNPHIEQKFYDWNVRLWKIGVSAICFGEKDIFISWCKFAKMLEKKNPRVLKCTYYRKWGDFDILRDEEHGWRGFLTNHCKEGSSCGMEEIDIVKI